MELSVTAVNISFSDKLRFSCTKCGACCRHVGKGIGLREKDLARLGDVVSETKSINEHPVFSKVLSSMEGVCSFLSDSSDCRIYSQRPLVCRLYPFYVSVLGDGSVQISIDHCPGVNLADSELVDQNYLLREVFSPLLEDQEIISILRDRILALKQSSFALTSNGEVRITWKASELLWKKMFELVRPDFGNLSPRDEFEILKCDLVPFFDALLESNFHQSTLEESSVTELFSENQESIDLILADSRNKQSDHKSRIQREGLVISPFKGTSLADGNTRTTFLLRTGQTFSVSSNDLLKMREIERDAILLEFDYLLEVVKREFVYAGVVVKPLTLQQEIDLLFYLADAIELTANALAILGDRTRVDAGLINQAISEVDATILSTVRMVGGEVPIFG